MSNPLSNPGPWTLVAEGYQSETVPVFRQYCLKAMELADYKPDGAVLDVACGPGTLSLLVAASARTVTAIDFSEGMLRIFRDLATAQKAENIDIRQMDGQKLDLPDAAFSRVYRRRSRVCGAHRRPGKQSAAKKN